MKTWRLLAPIAIAVCSRGEELDARGRLVVPGLIDVHHHSSYVVARH